MSTRVFIVDDSAFVRKALARVFGADPDIEVAGTAASGEEALARVPDARPDVVTLDVAMAGMDGLATLRGLLAWRPELPVIMLSAHTRKGAEATLDALAIGAVDFIDKTSFNMMDLDRLGRELLDRVKIWHAAGRRGRAGAAPAAPRRSSPAVAVAVSGLEVCVIGASTGGPAALQLLLEGLPAEFPLPIVIGQHMPVGFTKPFAQRLDAVCRVAVREAVEGDRLKAGTVLIAPAGRHLKLGARQSVRLSGDERAKYVPSIDVLMQSAAKAHAGRVLGVLLTGMGDDGAEGMACVHAQGGLTIAESEETCAVYGMPRAALLRGGVRYMWPLQDIAAFLRGLTATGA